MPCSVILEVYRGWGPKVLLYSFSKGSARFPYILFWAVYVCTFEPVYYPNFLVFVAFILGGNEKCSDGVASFEVHLDTQVIAGFLNFSPSPFVYGTMMEIFWLLDPLLFKLLCWSQVVVYVL